MLGRPAGWVSRYVKNFNVAIFPDFVNVVHVKLCRMAVLIKLYLSVSLSVTLILFQGHSSVDSFHLWIHNTSAPLSVSVSLWLYLCLFLSLSFSLVFVCWPISIHISISLSLRPTPSGWRDVKIQILTRPLTHPDFFPQKSRKWRRVSRRMLRSVYLATNTLATGTNYWTYSRCRINT